MKTTFKKNRKQKRGTKKKIPKKKLLGGLLSFSKGGHEDEINKDNLKINDEINKAKKGDFIIFIAGDRLHYAIFDKVDNNNYHNQPNFFYYYPEKVWLRWLRTQKHNIFNHSLFFFKKLDLNENEKQKILETETENKFPVLNNREIISKITNIRNQFLVGGNLELKQKFIKNFELFLNNNEIPLQEKLSNEIIQNFFVDFNVN